MEELEHQYGADALSEALDVSESGFARIAASRMVSVGNKTQSCES